MECAEIQQLIEKELRNNLEIAIYTHEGSIEVELYYDREVIDTDKTDIPGLPWKGSLT